MQRLWLTQITPEGVTRDALIGPPPDATIDGATRRFIALTNWLTSAIAKHNKGSLLQDPLRSTQEIVTDYINGQPRYRLVEEPLVALAHEAQKK
jgi:hypothetical protein